MTYKTSEIIDQQINLSQIKDSDAISWERFVQLANTAYEHFYNETIQSTVDDFGHQVLHIYNGETGSKHALPYNLAKIRGVYKKENERIRTKLEQDVNYKINGSWIEIYPVGAIEIEWNTTAPTLTFPAPQVKGSTRISKWATAEVNGTTVDLTYPNGDYVSFSLATEPIDYYLIGVSIVYIDALDNIRRAAPGVTDYIVASNATELWKIDADKCGYFYDDGSAPAWETIDSTGFTEPAITNENYKEFLGKLYYVNSEGNILMEYDPDTDTWNDITAEMFPNYAEIQIQDLIVGKYQAAVQTDKGIFIWDYDNVEPLYNDKIKTLIDYCENEDTGYGLIATNKIGQTVMIGCYLDTLINWPIGIYSEWMIAELAKQILIQVRQPDENIDELAQDYWERCMFHLHRDIGSPKKLRNRWNNRRVM